MIRSKSPLSLLALSLGLAFAQHSHAAIPSGAQKDAMARISSASTGKAEFSYNAATGGASFVSTPKGSALSSGSATTAADQKAHSLQFFKDNAALFGIRNAAAELSDPTVVKDNTGATHLNYKQTYQGLPVFGGELKSHYDKSGYLSAVNGVFVTDITLDTKPHTSADQASKQALNLISKQFAKSSGLSTSKPILMIFRKGLIERTSGSNYLAWMVEVKNKKDVHEFVYLDADSLKVLAQLTGIHTAMKRRAFDGEHTAATSNYPDHPFWVEGDAFPTGTTEADNMLAASKDVYDLFKRAFDRDSLDGKGLTLDAIFNLGGPNVCPNAFWDSGRILFCPGMTSDDVTAHELGHGLTAYTAQFIYENQPGALNEAYSDIWGETVDLINGRGTDTPDAMRDSKGVCTVFTQVGAGKGTDNSLRWLQGEDQTALNGGGAIRDMYMPGCYGHAGKVSDPTYHCAQSDHGGVHKNSGIVNHAYALTADGGTYNSQTITGLGLTKAAHIWYRALSVYGTSISVFSDQADALEKSCADLTGVNLKSLKTGELSGEIITASDCEQVAKANLAVELRKPTNCGHTSGPILKKDPPPLCASGTASALLADNFDGGKRGGLRWLVSHKGNGPEYVPQDFGVVTKLPDSRPGYALFIKSPHSNNCSGDHGGLSRLESPAFVIPAGEKNPMLTFDHWIATENYFDGGNIKVQVNDGEWQELAVSDFIYNPYIESFESALKNNTNPLASEWGFMGDDDGKKNGSWGRSIVKLSRIARPGDTVKLRFEFGVDWCGGSDKGWYIDDLMVYQCKP